MATSTMTYGERRFRASYFERILVSLCALGFVVIMWAAQDRPDPSAHPSLVYISVALIGAAVAELSEVVRVASLCGLGQAAPLSILSALREFPAELG